MGSNPFLAYIYINIDPVIVHIGALALRWYGLMYVVGILMGLWFIRRYTARKGITSDKVYRILWWSVVAGLIGGRLYFVVQQPNLVSYYLAQPWHILATWEGGMAFFGAIFFVVPVIFWRARVRAYQPTGSTGCWRVVCSHRADLRAHRQHHQWRYRWLSQYTALGDGLPE